MLWLCSVILLRRLEYHGVVVVEFAAFNLSAAHGRETSVTVGVKRPAVTQDTRIVLRGENSVPNLGPIFYTGSPYGIQCDLHALVPVRAIRLGLLVVFRLVCL